MRKNLGSLWRAPTLAAAILLTSCGANNADQTAAHTEHPPKIIAVDTDPPTTTSPPTTMAPPVVRAETAGPAVAAVPKVGSETSYAAIQEAFGSLGADLVAKATRVAACECCGDSASPYTLNAAAYTSGYHVRGLFQIHEIHADDWLSFIGRSYWDSWWDPFANAAYARKLYDSLGWQPWGGGDYCAAA
jgi:hypothetical protein